MDEGKRGMNEEEFRQFMAHRERMHDKMNVQLDRDREQDFREAMVALTNAQIKMAEAQVKETKRTNDIYEEIKNFTKRQIHMLWWWIGITLGVGIVDLILRLTIERQR